MVIILNMVITNLRWWFHSSAHLRRKWYYFWNNVQTLYTSPRDWHCTSLRYIDLRKCITSFDFTVPAGLPYDELKKRLPHDVDIACWNSHNNCTISGPSDTIDRLVQKFETEKIFSRAVNTSNMAFHSRYVKEAGPVFYKYLQKVNASSNTKI